MCYICAIVQRGKPKKWRRVHDDWQQAIFRYEGPADSWIEIVLDKAACAFKQCRIGLGVGEDEKIVQRLPTGAIKSFGTAKRVALELFVAACDAPELKPMARIGKPTRDKN